MYNRFENDAARIYRYRKNIEDETSFMTQIMIDAGLAVDEAHMLSRTTTNDVEQLSMAADYYAVALSGYNRLYRETGLKFARECFEGISRKLISLLKQLGKQEELLVIEHLVAEFSALPELEYRNPDRDRIGSKKLTVSM